MSDSLKIRDWVNSYSKGIYRVERIIDQYYDESDSADLDENNIGDKNPERIIVSKRLLNSKFKKLLGYESCSEAYIIPLEKKQLAELKQVLGKSPEYLIGLDNYKIPVIESIYNSPIQIDNEEDMEKVLGLIKFINTGKTFLDIQTEMRRLNILQLIPFNYGNYHFQLVNYDEESLNKRKVWRDAKLYMN